MKPKLRALQQKLKSNSGFSLGEALVCVILVGIITLALATGIQFGYRSFFNSLTQSEGQALCSSLTSAIQNELRYAIYDSSSETYKSPSYGDSINTGSSSSFKANDSGEIVYVDNGGNENRLISSATYSFNNKAVVEYAYDSNKGIFTVKLAVYNGEKVDDVDSVDSPIATNTFQVKPLSFKKKSS